MATKSESLWTRTATIFSSKAANYQLVDDVEEPSKTTPHKRIITSPQWKLGLIFISLIATGAAGSFLLWWQPFHHNSTTQISSETDTLTCGSTNEEAIARGCVMEPMVYGWMPAPCYIADLSSQYTPFSDRTWYTSHNYTNDTIIPEADIWAAKHKHIYTHQYHGEHCLFLWRKLALAVERRLEWLDTKTLNVEHADHCSEVLEDHGIEFMNSSSDVVFGFYTCIRLNWAK